jgi:DNA repair protein RAD16
VNGDDASSSDFPELSNLVAHMSAKKEKASKGRVSLSSVATSHDYNEDSGYSTPATSAAPTPAERPKTSTARRGRRSTAMATAESSSLAFNAIARAAALRNSQFSLNSATKRKRVIEDSED